MIHPAAPAAEKKAHGFDANRVREDFPILSQRVYASGKSAGVPLVYFDNAATSQKPQVVIDALTAYYSEYNANIHRGVHYLSQKASQAYDDVRLKVRDFIGARSEREIIFTRGTTESINLVAASYGHAFVREGQEVLITAMEHHSNIVPWQMLCERTGAKLRVIPMNDAGELDLDSLEQLVSYQTRIVSLVHISNSLGTVNPVKDIIRRIRARASRAVVLIDAAQSAIHHALDVADLDCDFLAFSGHKMLGPTGVGILYGRERLLEAMPPYQGGGEMIHSVSFEHTEYNEIPYKFEAGTPNVADVIAFGTAIDYLRAMDRKGAALHEKELLAYAARQLAKIPGVRLVGTAREKTSIVSFVIEGVNALDAGMYLDTLGIAVRTGHHCTEPVMKRMNIPGTLRASFLFYNTFEEIDALADGVNRAITFLKK